MAKATTNISGSQLAGFCRELFAESLDGDRELADALVRDFSEHVTAIRVRRDRLTRLSRGSRRGKPKIEVAAEAVQPPPAAVAAVVPAAKPSPPAVAALAAEPGEKPFDPYAFSVIALMSKKGRDALAKRLQEIREAAHLHALAEAQGLEIDAVTIAATGEALDDLRLAIVKAAEQRIADRRAAAS